MTPKTSKAVSWTKSNISDLVLDDSVDQGSLPAHEEIEWRVLQEETHPQPTEGEIAIFADHLHRGFQPPGSKFFRDVLHFFNLMPQDLGPNSMFLRGISSYKANHQFLPGFFYINRQTECKNGQRIELGGISIQRRKPAIFPEAKLSSHPKGWHRTWFYCKDTAPAQQHPLPGYRIDCLNATIAFLGWASNEEMEKLKPYFPKINALISHGLIGVDLTWCWISWRIQPLGLRGFIMCNYTDEPKDAQRFSSVALLEDEITKATKKLLGETREKCNLTGLPPFCISNPIPPVSHLHHSSCMMFIILFSLSFA